MRDPDQQFLALECLKLAQKDLEARKYPGADVDFVVQFAGKFYAFVSGEEVDGAEQRLNAVLEIVSRQPA